MDAEHDRWEDDEPHCRRVLWISALWSVLTLAAATAAVFDEAAADRLDPPPLQLAATAPAGR